MRKFTVLFLFFSFIAFHSLPLISSDNPKGVKLSKNGTDYSINFELPAYNMNSVRAGSENYTNLSIDDYGITGQPGYPSLPQITFNMVIPENVQSLSAIDVKEQNEIVYLSQKIYPAQAPWSKTNRIEDRPFTINREYYNTKGTESPLVTISEPLVIAGVRGVRVTITPFSYSPVDNKLTLVRKASFTIKMGSSTVTRVHHSSAFNEYLSNIFVNYEPLEPTPTSNYLIITAPDYESGMAPFVTHKTNLGYNVFMANTTVTGNTGADIKNFILQRYNNPQTRPEFILLVGDIDKIPEWVGGGEGNPHTDLYYSLLDGNDLYADAFLGRFSVANMAQLSNLINKTIFMETNVSSLPKKGIFMASNDFYTITEATQNYVIDTFFSPAGYAYQKLYVHTNGATTQQLINALNANQTFAIYSGHGSTTSWDDGPPLNNLQVMALTNTVYPFVYSFACLTGQFETVECFGETWTRTTNGGSVFFGATMSSYWDEDDIFERKIFRAMFPDGLIKASPMFQQGKIYLIQYYGNITPTLQRYIEMYNCLGDPSLYEEVYGPTIAHMSLHDTENLNGPYTVNCTILPHGSAVNPSRTKLLWTRGSTFTDSVSMTNTSGNNWSASIPGNGSQSIYRYYIKTSDYLNRPNVQPLGAPGRYYSFRAMPDTVKPVIIHTPIGDQPRAQWPATVSANVTDNIGIDSVWVKWYKNNTGTGIKQFRLNNTSGTIFSAPFNSDVNQVAVNDSIFYRIYARDNSSNHNTDSTALIRFHITGVTDICIGSGTVAVPHPFNTYWKSNRTDMVFPASDIIGAGGNTGTILKIGFDVVSASPQVMQNFTLKMQHTNLSSINGFTETGWTTVYSGTYTLPGPGLQYITLQNPFYWNGSQNLLIELCFADSTTTSTSTVNSTIVPGKTWNQRQDNLLGCGMTGGSPMDGRPNLCLQMSIIVGTEPISSAVPQEFSLEQNFPNPFNPSTTIKYSLPFPSRRVESSTKGGVFTSPSPLERAGVRLCIYDLLGHLVKTIVNERQQPGYYSVTFDASSFASGVYFYKLTYSNYSAVKKMVLIK